MYCVVLDSQHIRLVTDTFRTCPKTQSWLYGYDAYAEAEAAFANSPF
jgi:hypothetical protein